MWFCNSPRYCKKDVCPLDTGKPGSRTRWLSSSQETCHIWCCIRLSMGKIQQSSVHGHMAWCVGIDLYVIYCGVSFQTPLLCVINNIVQNDDNGNCTHHFYKVRFIRLMDTSPSVCMTRIDGPCFLWHREFEADLSALLWHKKCTKITFTFCAVKQLRILLKDSKIEGGFRKER